MPHQARILSVVVAYPKDVEAEVQRIPKVLDELNRSVAADRGLFLHMLHWKTDAYPGFHSEGPPGVIDSCLHIEDCDILVYRFTKTLPFRFVCHHTESWQVNLDGPN
jgi:hypothetical protein